MEAQNNKRPNNGLNITLAVLLCVLSVYFLWLAWDTIEQLIDGVQANTYGIGVFYTLICIIEIAGCLFFGVLSLLKISKGECTGRIFTISLIVAPCFYFLTSLVNLIGYSAIGLITGIDIFRQLMFLFWSLAIILLGVFAFINLLGKKKLLSFLSAGLFAAQVLFLLFGNFGGLVNYTTTGMLGLGVMLAYCVIYIIKIVREPKECECVVKEEVKPLEKEEQPKEEKTNKEE